MIFISLFRRLGLQKIIVMLMAAFCIIIYDEINIESVSATTIVSEDYSQEWGKNYPYDPDYGTSLASRFKYQNGKIYMQIELGTWRSTGWDHIWLKNPEKNIIKQWDVQRSLTGEEYHINGRSIYRKELEWVDIGGSKPTNVTGVIYYKDGKYIYDLTSSSNGVKQYTYDYTWSNESYSEYVPSEGTSASVQDYLTGFYYIIDHNPNTDIQPGQPGVKRNTNGRIDITDEIINDSKTCYIHVKSRSYTGLLSDRLDTTLAKVHIKYDANGGTGTMKTDHFLYGNGATIKNNEFSRKGYAFKGWNTQPDGSGNWYNIDQIVETQNMVGNGGICTLYAQWTCTDSFIQYIGNGGTLSDNKTSFYDRYDNTSKKNSFIDNKFSKYGYDFDNWSDTSDGKGVHSPGDSLTFSNSGYTTIQSAINNSFGIDLDCDRVDNGTNIHCWNLTNNTAQRWSFCYAGTVDGINYWYIVNTRNGKVLDVDGGNAASGTNIQLYEFNGSTAQKWTLELTEDGYYYIRSKLGNYYIDLSGGNATSGTNIQLYEFSGTSSQKWKLANISINAYAQWKPNKITVCFHSEDDKENMSKEYTYGTSNQKFIKASNWWRKQKKGYTWIGWSETKGAKDITYIDENDVLDSWIVNNSGKVINLYSVWDKPTVKVYPTKNNVSFKCDNKTYYKEPVEIEVKGYDNRFKVDMVSMRTDKKDSCLNIKSSSYAYKYDRYYCDSTDKIMVYAKCKAQDGESEEVSTEVYLDYTSPIIEYYVNDEQNVEITATDSQSGVDTLSLEFLKNNEWVKVKEIRAKEQEYKKFVTTINTTKDNYKYKYRIKVTDHIGNSSYSKEFFVVPMTLKSTLRNINGDIAYKGETLEYYTGGNMTAILNVGITGYPDHVEYEYSNELGQITEIHEVTPDESGNVKEEKSFNIPEGLEYNKRYLIKVTAYRGNEKISSTQYIRLKALDFSKFRSRIRYQSGQNN